MNKYIEFLRLAYIAGSDAAENAVKQLNYENNQNVYGYIKIDGRCKLARFLKMNSKVVQNKNGLYFIFDNCFMVKPLRQEHTELHFEYSNYNIQEKCVVEKAMDAIYYVLRQVEPNIEIVIKNC